MPTPGILFGPRLRRAHQGLQFSLFVAPSHLRGTATISDVATTVAVTLDYAQPNATYGIIARVNALSGSPSAASLRQPWVSSRTATGFTLNVEAAPGAGTSVTIRWLLMPSTAGGNGAFFGFTPLGWIGAALFSDFVFPSATTGTATISDAATTATVTLTGPPVPSQFGLTAPGATIQLGIVSETGTPVAGARRPYVNGYTIVNDHLTAFSVAVEAAPGVGNSITFAWLLIPILSDISTIDRGGIGRALYWWFPRMLEFVNIGWPLTSSSGITTPQVQVAAPNTSVAQSFLATLPMSDYGFFMTAEAVNTAGSNRAYGTTTATAFTLNVEVAPATGNQNFLVLVVP